jgi:hypothetical protein
MEDVSLAADGLIVVCFDTKSWTHNANTITKVGIFTFDSRVACAVKHVSEHGENLLKHFLLLATTPR